MEILFEQKNKGWGVCMISVCLNPAFIAMICILFAFAGESMTLLFLLSCLAHEAGHILLCTVWNVPVYRLTVRPGGAVLSGNFSGCSYPREAMIHIAGIMVNFLSAGFLHACGCHPAAGLNCVLGIYNFLPLPGHDGERFFRALISMSDHRDRYIGILTFVSGIVQAILYVFAAWLFWFGMLHAGYGSVFLCGALFWSVNAGLGRRLFLQREN
ncbi:MAG: hypothetical protein ACI3XM_00355 [Eubacteriales bacterium]